ncbi:MAG TPA: substrate-binding domain-containing protein, partial [Spirochaetia bacterium]|nr:substrate-binding domain-containing protein [Spirochaetia bacterium]
SNITTDNLAKIYHGDIVNWKDVGGPDLPIVVVNRDESSGTYVAFWEIVCQKPFGKAIAYTKNAIVAKENGEVAAKVASTPGSIGYVGMAFVEEVTKAGGRNLMVNGVADTIANVVAKKYPISRQLYLVTKGEAAAGSVEKAFIDYVLSPKGQAIVKSVDFIPVPKS